MVYLLPSPIQAMPVSTGGISNHHVVRGSIGAAEASVSPARQPVSRTKSEGSALLIGSTESGDTSLSLSGRITKSPPATGVRRASKSSKEKAEEVARKVVSLYTIHVRSHAGMLFLVHVALIVYVLLYVYIITLLASSYLTLCFKLHSACCCNILIIVLSTPLFPPFRLVTVMDSPLCAHPRWSPSRPQSGRSSLSSGSRCKATKE